jgi:hypothetical protein
VQIVGYETGDGGLLLAEDGHVEHVPLDPGVELAYTLGERHCAGTLHDGDHVACDADAVPYCRAHDSTWVCARCTGTCLKDEMDCLEEHAVYLAAFAPAAFKVGVTKLWRLETRLREQGADRGAHVRTVPDGRIARRVEASLAADVGDAVRVSTKRAGLHEAVDEAAWERLLADFDVEERFAFEYGLEVVDRPVPETVAAGTVCGTKGRLLVVERSGTTYAVDLRDLVGYEVSRGRGERDLQASLGAFG